MEWNSFLLLMTVCRNVITWYAHPLEAAFLLDQRMCTPKLTRRRCRCVLSFHRLRSGILHRTFPYDNNIEFHKIIACVIFVSAIAHRYLARPLCTVCMRMG
jgi:hypothetical protein